MSSTLRSAARRLTLAFVVVLVVAFAVAIFPTRTTAQANQSGRLRFIHAVPGAPAVDIALDNIPAVRGLAFASATRYLSVAVGDHTITISASGSATPIYQGKVTVTPAAVKTAVAQGTAAILEVALYDDELGPTAPGKTRVTAIHAIKDGPAVDVLEDNPGATVLPLIQNLAYGAPYGTIDIAAGLANIAVVPANADPDKAIVKLEKTPLLAGTLNTFLVLGTTSGAVKPTLVVISAPVDADDPASSGFVRLVHANADAPAIDIYVNNSLVAPGLSFGDFTPHISLTSGKAIDVAIRASGSAATAAPLLSGKLDLLAGQAMTVYVAGTGSAPTILVAEDNIAKLDPKTARVRVINATGTGVATLNLKGGAKDVTSKSTAPAADVALGVYEATLTVDQPVIKTTSTLVLSGGVIYDVLIAGSEKNNKLIVATTGLNEQAGSVPSSVAVAQVNTPASAATNAATVAATIAPTVAATPAVTKAATVATAVATEAVPAATIEATQAATLPPTPDINGMVQTAIAQTLTAQSPKPTTPAATAAVVAQEATQTTAPAVTPAATAQVGKLNIPGTATGVALTKQAQAAQVATQPAAPTATEDLLMGDHLTAIPTETATLQTVTAPTPVPGQPAAPVITAVVNTNPGVNLKLREYPNINAKTLALVPSQSTLQVNGVRAPASGKPAGTQTKTPTPTATATGTRTPVVADFSDIWIFVTWTQPDNSTVTGWVTLQYVSVTKDNKPLRGFADINSLPKVPEDTFGVIGSTSVTPVGIDVNRIIGTVTLQAGVRLQLRRTPSADGESLTLLDDGTQVTVISQTTVVDKKQPTQTPGTVVPGIVWLFIRYDISTGVYTGWISSQYVKLSRKGKPADLKEVPDAVPADNLPRGELQGGGGSVPVAQPTAAGIVALVNKVDEGTNLQLRQQPNANAFAVDKIPGGTVLAINGRNGNGAWLQVQYNGQVGWISTAYVTVSKNGKAYAVADLKNVSTEPDTAKTPTATPTATIAK